MTFTKLFSSITESTVWMEPANIRLVWITMLAMSDRRGRVWASVPGLASRARVPEDDCRKALKMFMGPDPDSRTKDNEGRRIEPIDGGWRLLNHAKYRAIRDEEAIRESKRKYINTRRSLERGVENVDRCRANAESEADADADAETEYKRGRGKTPTKFKKFPSVALKAIPLCERALMEIELRGDKNGRDKEEFDKITKELAENKRIVREV